MESNKTVSKVTASDTISEVKLEPKPLSDNEFLAFFQKIWRWWMGVWSNFSENHPKGSKIIYQIFFFIIFSEGVTIFQILVLIFLPELFGLELAGTAFEWPQIKITLGDFSYMWNFLGYTINYNKAGEVIIGGGLGYFLAFEIAVFLAQCINFPLQRNITYKSHGNPAWQAMWYFIGWLLVSLLCNIVNGFWIPIGQKYLPPAVYSILVMIAQGGIAMVIFFFIFMVIFPDVKKEDESKQKKLASAKAALDAAKESGNEQKISIAQKNYNKASEKAQKARDIKDRFDAETTIATLTNSAETKIISYLALQKEIERKKAHLTTISDEKEKEKETEFLDKLIEKCQQDKKSAQDAVLLRDEKVPAAMEVVGRVIKAQAKDKK